MSETYDLLLTGGTVLNPATGLRQQLDIGVKDGRVAALQEKLARAEAKRVIEVPGCYVTPGLIDFHVHSFWGVNPYGCDIVCRLLLEKRPETRSSPWVCLGRTLT